MELKFKTTFSCFFFFFFSAIFVGIFAFNTVPLIKLSPFVSFSRKYVVWLEIFGHLAIVRLNSSLCVCVGRAEMFAFTFSRKENTHRRRRRRLFDIYMQACETQHTQQHNTAYITF